METCHKQCTPATGSLESVFLLKYVVGYCSYDGRARCPTVSLLLLLLLLLLGYTYSRTLELS